MRVLLYLPLRVMARYLCARYAPLVVGVTGSRGKTSTKDAIAVVLARAFRIYASKKSYNNELGLPLGILGEESGGSSIARWLGIFLRGLARLIRHDPHYPQIVVLEYGADRPGDIEHLASIARPHVAVVTGIGAVPVHIEFYRDREAVAYEKSQLVRALPADGVAVLNADDPLVAAMRTLTPARTITYGITPDADIHASEVTLLQHLWEPIRFKDELIFIELRFLLHARGETISVKMPNVAGKHFVYSALAAAAVGLSQGMPFSAIAEGLSHFKVPPGRLQFLPGRNESGILDDTYNASPDAVKAALRTLGELHAQRRIAVLGDMRELGRYSPDAHREIGRACAGVCAILAAVGENREHIAEGARSAGMRDNRILLFAESGEAATALAGELQPHDLVLIKGSQGVRMERITATLLRDPHTQRGSLVRQEPEWLKK